MKHGRMFFAFSLFCFIALIALSFVSLTDTVTDSDFQRSDVEHAHNYDSDVTVFGFEVDLIDFSFLILIYTFAAFIPTFIKFVVAGLLKRRLAIASAVIDVIFVLAGSIIAIDIFMDGIALNPLTFWTLSSALLPLLSFVCNILGLKRQKRDLYGAA